jgi:hypothetical protein
MRKLYSLFFLLGIVLNSTAQWNSNTAVNLEMAGVKTADMQAAITTTGRTWVAFYHQNGSNYDMRAQLLDVNGNKLLGPNGVLVSNKPTGSATFVFNVCTDAADNLIIAAQDQRTGANINSAVMFKVGLDGTLLWGPDGVLVGPGLSPYPAVLSNGETVVAWSESASNTINLQKVTTGGTLAWTTAIPVRVGTTRTSRGQLIANSNGTFAMVFQRAGVGISTTLYAQRYNNDGTAIWAPLQIGSQTTSGARYYSIAADNDTTYFGYYASQGSRFNSFLQRINPNGTIPYGMNGSNFNTSVAAADPYQQMTNIATLPGSPYVWSICTFSNTSQTQYGIYVQKFAKADGARQFGATGKNIYPITADRQTQTGNISLINDAPFFMHYDLNYKIFATRVDAAGDFVWPGNFVEMSSTTAGGSTPKGRFCFTALSGSQGIAAWYESRAGEYRPYAQNITPGGLFLLQVATQGAVPATITTGGGTLQMTASVFPATANQNVTWSLVPGTTANASISATGLVTAQTNGNGTVWAKAVSVQDNTVKDSMLITISGQTVTVTGLDVQTLNNIPSVITTNAGTLQMVAVVTPSNATNQNVVWSIVPVTGTATISPGGLVTAVVNGNGTVWAKAVSVGNPTIKDSLLVTISGQYVPVTSIDVTTLGNQQAIISITGGSLQMVAVITPATATNQAVTWSIVPVSGSATINAAGLMTALDDGTVWAKAISVDNPNLKDSLLITIGGQRANSLLEGIQIYPIPTSGVLHFKLLKNHNATNMRITDMGGRTVYWEHLAANALRTEKVINLAGLAPGVYMVRFYKGGIYVAFKIMKI